MTKKKTSSLLAAIVLAGTLGAGTSSQGASWDLPNLVPLPPESNTIFVGPPDGADTPYGALRFSVAIANRGRFALDLVPVPTHVTEGLSRARAEQCVIWVAGRACRKREQVGEFLYHAEADHRHYHFEGFASYELRSLRADGTPEMDGPPVAGGQKVSFCLEDVDPEEDGLAYQVRNPSNPVYVAACIGTLGIQGISPGWRDVYSWDLTGQQILLDGVPDDVPYALMVRVNPEQRLLETTTEDNTAYQVVTLRDGGTRVEVEES